MRLGILTGGGDVPGLNAVDQGLRECGRRPRGTRSPVSDEGGAGCSRPIPTTSRASPANSLRLDPGVVRTIDRSGGTFLHTSRTNPAKVRPNDEPAFLAAGRIDDGPRDHTAHALRVIERLGLDALVPIGGDDTLSFGLRLHQEGVTVIAIPKTMDNDVHGTDYCIGFSTAVTRAR